MGDVKVFEVEDVTSRDVLGRCLDELSSWLSEFSVKPGDGYVLCLTLDEVFMNIMEHGYQGKAGWVRVSVYVFSDEQVIVIVVSDKAQSFNPISEPSVSLPSSDSLSLLSDSSVHAGLRLVKSFIDQVQYRRLQSGNELTLYKYYGDVD